MCAKISPNSLVIRAEFAQEKTVFRRIVPAMLILASALTQPVLADPLLAAAVLPNSRATQTGNTVTAFATIVNSGTSAGEACGITLNAPQPITFGYQTTNSVDNSLTGSPNTPVDLPVGAGQSFVMSFTMTGTFASEDIQPVFSCRNGGTAAVLSGINTILLTSSEENIPDLVTLVATVENSGFAEIPGVNGTGVFSIALSNVGETGDITVTADAGPGGSGVNVLLCETNSETGDCINPTTPDTSVFTTAFADSTLTFATFVQGNGEFVAEDAVQNRAFVRFVSSGVISGLTSVAFRTSDPIVDPIAAPTPDPVPDPIADPVPEPIADPIPDPAPDPSPVAGPIPDPVPDPIADPVPEQTPSASFQVWANNGGDKVLKEEIRSYTDGDVFNSVWDGTTIRAFGARNEVVAFNVVVDNNGADLSQVSVEFSRLENDNFAIETTNTTTASLFDWNARPIEVFAVGYLKILGLSRIGFQWYDETHIPEGMRRPFDNFQPAAPAVGRGLWEDRPNHNKSYPDIAEPIEIRGSVPVASGNSQSFWVDVYIGKDTPAGVLTGTLGVRINGVLEQTIPVELLVADLTLPDERVAKAMVHIEGGPIASRHFLGRLGGILSDDQEPRYRQIVDNHFKLAWRHGLSLIDLNQLVPEKRQPVDRPNEDWLTRLTGGAYTAAEGYVGPGQNLPHDVFSIGSYTQWAFWWDLRRFDPEAGDLFDPGAPLSELRRELEFRTDQWETWFQTNAPATKRFLYADDEPSFSFEPTGTRRPIDFANQVSQFVAENPGPGGNLDTLVTFSPLEYDNELPVTNILGTVIAQGQTDRWEAATGALTADPNRNYLMYNGQRPASGSFVTEDDGIALRELAWGQYKLGIPRWFYWNGNYWNNFLGGESTRNPADVDPTAAQFRFRTRTNVFKSAHTFGRHTERDPIGGEGGGFNYSNGDGVLMYPGTDLIFPEESRGIDGPIASLRMKHWRRGIQDVQYLSLAMEVDPAATQAIIDSMVPAAMWEIGVTDENDPSFVNLPPSWSNDADLWERARAQLINIILGSEVVDVSGF